MNGDLNGISWNIYIYIMECKWSMISFMDD